MAAKRKKTTAKLKVRKTTKRSVTTSHRGYHAEHIAMLYRLGGAGIVIVAGTVIIFLVKVTFSL